MSKFFLLIAVALLLIFECSINAQVAFKLDAPKSYSFSTNGLEGFADDGIRIIVEDYSNQQKNYPLKQIKDQVELRLRQAKIKIGTGLMGSSLHINCQPIDSFYHIGFDAMRRAYFVGEILHTQK